jgi:RNA polymerase sigma-70 factor (ECF subfamily)
MQKGYCNVAALTDDELVNLAQQGDHPAFTELIRRNYPSCFRTAIGILRDSHDAEDELQNACWKAYEHIGQFQQDAKFSTWLTRIVVNQCLMRLRQERRAKFLYLDEPQSGENSIRLELADGRLTPEDELGRQQAAELIEREIRRIPPMLRNVFLLRDVEKLPMPAVAGRLGISVAAAKSRLLRARVELRSRLQKHCPQIGPAALTA